MVDNSAFFKVELLVVSMFLTKLDAVVVDKFSASFTVESLLVLAFLPELVVSFVNGVETGFAIFLEVVDTCSEKSLASFVKTASNTCEKTSSAKLKI